MGIIHLHSVVLLIYLLIIYYMSFSCSFVHLLPSTVPEVVKLQYLLVTICLRGRQ